MTNQDENAQQRNPDKRSELEERLREANALSRADRRAKGAESSAPSSAAAG
ncbi:hypothetical protein [Streptomyces hoynatensis]|uniref:hypothetical protein n=1 Tax=Streptomyces hoynatensis TaxID=1141874 RepID=UPI00131A372B|nr:hypothetical protein [Streptomyces hoynatensis]